MGGVIGEVLPEAVGVAISPIPIIAVVLLLASAKGKANALPFLLGWLIGLGLVGIAAKRRSKRTRATRSD